MVYVFQSSSGFDHIKSSNSKHSLYYRKRGSASYIVREVLLVREREREIQRKRER